MTDAELVDRMKAHNRTASAPAFSLPGIEKLPSTSIPQSR